MRPPTTFRACGLLTALACIACAAAAQAAGRAELVVVLQPRAAITASQAWVRALGEAGVENVRMREARAGDKVGIETGGTPQSPLYVVTGVLSGDELLLPGARFRRDDAAGVARWLADLAERGPPGERPAKAAFGLSPKQFELVHADLSRPVTFSTKDVARDEVVARIARGLQLPVQPSPAQIEALKADKVAEELSGLTSGTALACVLRPAGYALVPQAAGERPGHALLEMRPGMEIWPVGWPPEKDRKEVLPALFEFLNVNIQGVSVAEALNAIAGRLNVPYLLDHNALARHGIDPAKTPASLPAGRTFYSKALERVLFQAGLKSELRVDESGKPLLWVTSIKSV